MSLTEFIAGVETHEKSLIVFNADAAAVEDVRERSHDRNLTVAADRTESGTPRAFVVLADDEVFLTAASVDDVLGAGRDGTTPEFEAETYRPVLDHPDETLFTSYDADQMVAASREIEDRAWRVGSGSLYAGFQRLSILEVQFPVYRRLAERGDLSVHAFVTPDGDIPDHDSDLTIHVERGDEIARTWFVVFDGAGVDVNKCALLAEGRTPRSFYGFWTYDPDTVDWMVDHLKSTYGPIEPA